MSDSAACQSSLLLILYATQIAQGRCHWFKNGTKGFLFNVPCVPPESVFRWRTKFVISMMAGTLKGHSDLVSSIASSQDGARLASASDDSTVKIWDPATSQSVSTLKGHGGSINSIAWSPDGTRLASASNDNTVRIWDPATSQGVLTLEGHGGSINSIAWSPSGARLASASDDKTGVHLWSSW